MPGGMTRRRQSEPQVVSVVGETWYPRGLLQVVEPLGGQLLGGRLELAGHHVGLLQLEVAGPLVPLPDLPPIPGHPPHREVPALEVECVLGLG